MADRLSHLKESEKEPASPPPPRDTLQIFEWVNWILAVVVVFYISANLTSNWTNHQRATEFDDMQLIPRSELLDQGEVKFLATLIGNETVVLDGEIGGLLRRWNWDVHSLQAEVGGDLLILNISDETLINAGSHDSPSSNKGRASSYHSGDSIQIVGEVTSTGSALWIDARGLTPLGRLFLDGSDLPAFIIGSFCAVLLLPPLLLIMPYKRRARRRILERMEQLHAGAPLSEREKRILEELKEV